MDARTAHALFGFGKPAVVFGRRLRRLTVRHCAALELAVPAVWRGGRSISPGDAAAAAAICAARDERELRAAMFPAGGRRRQWWRGFWWGVRWGAAWIVEWAKLDAWIAEELTCGPRELPGQRSGGRQLGTEWTVRLAVRLARDGNMPLAEAWWTPVGEAMHVAAAAREAEGRETRLMSEELEAELKELGWTDEDLGIA